MDMSLVTTDDVRSFKPEPGMIRQVLAYNQKLMLIRHYFDKGWVGTKHQHPHEQLVYVLKGRLRIEIDGKKPFEVKAGESFVVDGGIDHQASALEDVEVLDVFTPVREDYKELLKS